MISLHEKYIKRSTYWNLIIKNFDFKSKLKLAILFTLFVISSFSCLVVYLQVTDRTLEISLYTVIIIIAILLIIWFIKLDSKFCSKELMKYFDKRLAYSKNNLLLIKKLKTKLVLRLIKQKVGSLNEKNIDFLIDETQTKIKDSKISFSLDTYLKIPIFISLFTLIFSILNMNISVNNEAELIRIFKIMSYYSVIYFIFFMLYKVYKSIFLNYFNSNYFKMVELLDILHEIKLEHLNKSNI